MIGSTKTERILSIILDPEDEEGIYYPVTARVASKKEQKLYKQEKECKKMTKTKNPIPEFKNREEEAKFFDTHDMADYQDEFKTLRARFANNLSEGIRIKNTIQTIELY